MNENAQNGQAGAGRRIVLSRNAAEHMASRRPPPRVFHPARAFRQLCIALVVLVGVFFLCRFFMISRPHLLARIREVRTEHLPPRTVVEPAREPAAPETAAPAAVPEASPRAAERDRRTGDKIRWDDPDFLAGAKAFNQAYALLPQLKGSPNPQRILTQIEGLCREAIERFEHCRDRAPDGVDIDRFVRQGYQMIADARQTTLLNPSAAPPPSPRPQPSTPPASAPSRFAPAPSGPQIALSPGWRGIPVNAAPVLLDLERAFGGIAQPGEDTSLDTNLVLYRGVHCGMSVRDAERALNVRLGSRRRIATPGLPAHSLNYFTADGDFGDAFHKLIVVTDQKDQIVAVQLVNEKPDEVMWLDPPSFNEDIHMIDFIRERKRPASCKAARRATAEGDLIRLDCEAAAISKDGYFGMGTVRERVLLFAPRGLVSLILKNAERR